MEALRLYLSLNMNIHIHLGEDQLESFSSDELSQCPLPPITQEGASLSLFFWRRSGERRRDRVLVPERGVVDLKGVPPSHPSPFEPS